MTARRTKKVTSNRRKATRQRTSPEPLAEEPDSKGTGMAPSVEGGGAVSTWSPKQPDQVAVMGTVPKTPKIPLNDPKKIPLEEALKDKDFLIGVPSTTDPSETIWDCDLCQGNGEIRLKSGKIIDCPSCVEEPPDDSEIIDVPFEPIEEVPETPAPGTPPAEPEPPSENAFETELYHYLGNEATRYGIARQIMGQVGVKFEDLPDEDVEKIQEFFSRTLEDRETILKMVAGIQKMANWYSAETIAHILLGMAVWTSFTVRCLGSLGEQQVPAPTSLKG